MGHSRASIVAENREDRIEDSVDETQHPAVPTPAPITPPGELSASASFATYAPPLGPPEPPRGGRTAALVIGIVAGCIVILAAIGVGLYFVATSAVDAIGNLGPDVAESSDPIAPPEPIELNPLVIGTPSEPIAVTPTDCPSECFTFDGIGATVAPDSEYIKLGVPVEVSAWGDFPSASVRKEFAYASRTWGEGEGEPEECFVTYLSAPIAIPYSERPETVTDSVHYVTYRSSEDEYSGIDQTVRLFDDSANAVAHMRALFDQVAQCTSYDIGKGAEYWTADVTPLPALTLPGSVAAAGWVEDSPFGRFYVVDLQRGNLVIRSALSTTGAVTEEDYRSFIETLATQLDRLEP
jgi:hypothetical protein